LQHNEDESMDMQNKIALVTAAASGTGRAGALILAREGAAVAVVDQNETGAKAVVDEIRKAGGRALALAGDLRDDAFARDIVAATVREFGGQLLQAMLRYRNTMKVIGKCRLVVTPLASKLITVGCALACFEMKLKSTDYASSVAIPYAEPRRYEVTIERLMQSRPVISALLLTGDAYQM
jgi:NAD(P)-dependent dehydrogenase (short-subunit alcohol dehydrogenase family)